MLQTTGNVFLNHGGHGEHGGLGGLAFFGTGMRLMRKTTPAHGIARSSATVAATMAVALIFFGSALGIHLINKSAGSGGAELSLNAPIAPAE